MFEISTRFHWGSLKCNNYENYLEISRERIKETCEANETKCWIWKGYRCEPKKLYGLTSLVVNGKKKKILSHRASYFLFKGEIPENLQVLHSCDTPLCCNPDHLHLGTAQLNMDEMKERGRERKAIGKANSSTKLNEDQVREIRDLTKIGYTQRELAKKFEVSCSNVNSILNYNTWKQILPKELVTNEENK